MEDRVFASGNYAPAQLLPYPQTLKCFQTSPLTHLKQGSLETQGRLQNWASTDLGGYSNEARMKPMYSRVLIKRSITLQLLPKTACSTDGVMSRSIHCWPCIYQGPKPFAHQYDQ